MFDLVATEPIEGVVVIAIIGELDISTAPRLREELIRVAADSETPKIVLDLAGVDLLDPTGLGVIFDGVKRTRLRGGDLVLARAEPQVRRDLEITRVIEILPVSDSVKDAIATLIGS
ncbi:MAG: STAS domain-containing protein [Actinobacteria bacterium]|nr:STAS domain-containing protein [Actinomycetota bacterium]